MLSKRLFLPALIIILACLSTGAQTSKLKEAKKLMNNLNYLEAIDIYNRLLEKEDVAEAKINIAECYRKIGDPVNAEFWYGQVVRLPEAEPVAKLYYGQMLQRNGKCDLARDWFNQYIQEAPDDLRGQFLSRACDYEQELMTKNAGIFDVKHLDFNSDLDDFSPGFFDKGIVFASDRDRGAMVKMDHAWTGHPFLELYFVESKELKKSDDGACGEMVYGRPEKFSAKLNSKYHEAAVSFSSKNKEIFFTRNNFKDGKTGKDDEGIVRLKVFSAKNLGEGRWGELESLPFNSDEYSVAHPALSNDGNTLYFTSDMPGGFGGMDIYFSKKESGRWGPPENLGPQINTEGHEVFPYVDKGGRLYFSSDGLIGLGGYDIHYTEEKAPGEWAAPENLGFPINTISDDFGIVFNDEGTCGYFSSDRSGGVGGDDLYSFRKTAAPVQIYVYNEFTKDPIANANIIDACTGRQLTTDAKGLAKFDMKLNTCCTFTASAEGFRENQKEGCTKNIPIGTKVMVEIPLQPATEFAIEGIVFDDGTGLPLEGATVTLSNDCGDTEPEAVVTDETGRFNFALKKDCCYKVKAAKERYLSNSVENRCTRGLEKSETFYVQLFLAPTIMAHPTEPTSPPVAGKDGVKDKSQVEPPAYRIRKDPNTGLYIDTKTGKPANGKIDGVEYKNGKIADEDVVVQPGPEKGVTPSKAGEPIAYLLHIYYDFDQSFIRDDAVPELDKLLKIMVETPEIIVEIGSHTDARGSSKYNSRLSQRRADAAVKWLTDRNIERDRLIPIGYGETVPVNNCKDLVPCNERDHQLNRRTEFRIVGCKGCVDKNAEVISRPNENVRVDACHGCPF
jgi:outer membrane protein OmpA-like peptidoglycan-associated protein